MPFIFKKVNLLIKDPPLPRLRMKPFILLAATYGSLATAVALGAEQRVSCPERLEPDAVQPAKPPKGWQLYMLRPTYLTEGGMLHGPPSESAFLVPDSSTSRKVGKQIRATQRWSFDVPHGYTKWMYCGYGGGGATLKLFKQVHEGAKECQLSSQSTDGRIKETVEFVCK